jgi:hypothetical protein
MRTRYALMMAVAIGMAFQTFQRSTQMVIPTTWQTSSTATRVAVGDDLLLVPDETQPQVLAGTASLVERLLWLPAQADTLMHDQVRALIMGETNEYNLTVTSHPLQHCNATSQVHIRIPPVEEQDGDGGTMTSRWILHAMDGAGRDKLVGGDEFYIAYRDTAHDGVTAVALVADRHDGSYALDFVTPPTTTVAPFNMSETGRLTVHVSYTCGIGLLAPPSKDHWNTGAHMRLQASLENVPRPPMRIFQPPRLSIDLANFTTVLGIGDSKMRQFILNDDLPNKTPRKPNLAYHPFRMPLNTTTLPVFQQVIQSRNKDLVKEGTALVLGSAAWDIIMTEDNVQGPDFGDHLKACRGLIQNVASRYPNVTILWKSPTDFHLHRFQVHCLNIPWCTLQSRYASSSRAQFLYQAQRALMQELQIPFLDLMEASQLSAEWTYDSDPRHFNVSFNDMTMDWFHGTNHSS